MLKIAITGNIASGKSCIEKILRIKGFDTLCLDCVTEKIYIENDNFKEKLFRIFGETSKNQIAKIVFDDNAKLKELENLIYPIILEIMFDFFNKNRDKKLVFVSVPMLYEAGFEKYFDRVIYVKSDYNIRLQRLLKRNNYTVEYAKKRLDSQLDDEYKIKKADYIVENNGSHKELNKNCEKLIKELNTL